MAAYERLKSDEVRSIAAKVGAAQAKLGVSLAELARRAGVSQPKAFEVKLGKFQYRTPILRKLELYVHMILGERDVHDVASLDAEIGAFLSAGGTVDELRAILTACTAFKSVRG